MRASISFAPLSRRAAVLVLLLFVATVTYAQITPSADAYTNTANPNTNYGANVLLDVASSQTTYIQFNLSSIPAGYTSADITKATLKLYVNTVTTAGSFNVDYVNGTWAESTITANLAPALGTTIVASVPLITAVKNQYILIDITAAVQAWLSGSQANDGIALVGNSPLNASFDSKENTTTSHPPELDIVFLGGGTIAGVTTASGSGLIGGGTSGTLNLSLTNTCAAKQILQWSGSAWACASAGTGTITGVTAGTDLTGGGTSGTVTLRLNTANVPLLAAANTFTGNQTVNGNLSATGVVTGSSFQIGSNLFAFGSFANYNAFLGFSGNATTTGRYNTAIGVQALLMNTTGIWNTAIGAGALLSNTTGNYNTATGPWTLTVNTTGEMNTATGAGTLNPNTTGSYNTATGSWALGANTTGGGNTASGDGALGSNTTGSSNTASGISALTSNTTGWQNTADGGVALQSNTTGFQNTASGYNALYNNTTGSQNTAAGWQALYNLITGDDNTALGYNAGPDASFTNLSNATAIGAYADVQESNALVLGSINGLNGATANTNVGIGTAAPQYTLDVHGTGNFTGLVQFASSQKFPGTGTIKGVTTAAGSGLAGGGTSGTLNLSLATNCASGQVLAWSGSAWACSSPGGTVTSVGLTAPSTDFVVTGSPVTTSGTLGLGWLVAPDPNNTPNAIVKRDSSGNFSAGTINAVSAFNLGGNAFAFGAYYPENAFLGFSGNTTMTGTANTATGYLALRYITSGSYNTASGTQALRSNQTGSYNTAVGYNALEFSTGSYNTASGANTLAGTNNTGSYNTASGYQALYGNTTGYFNTASGINALYSNTTGNNNTASGINALYSNTTGYDNTASGSGALYSNTTGSDLTCVGYLCTAAADGLSNATAIGAHAVVGASNSLVLGGTRQYAVKVGIGTTTPSNVLTIAQGAGHPVSDSWETFSSRRWKTNIRTLRDALEKVEQLRGVSYDLKANGQHEVGVIAEEVGAVVPEVVTWEKNGKDAQSVDYGRLTALLIEATKEQQALIHQQQAQIARLTRQVKTIQATLKANERNGSAVRTVKGERVTVHQ